MTILSWLTKKLLIPTAWLLMKVINDKKEKLELERAFKRYRKIQAQKSIWERIVQ